MGGKMIMNSQTARNILSAGIFMAMLMNLQADLYVSHDGSHTDPYDSWEKAATNIQTAVTAAPSGSTIWIADGTYSAASGETNIATIAHNKSMTLYGNTNFPAQVILDGKGTAQGLYASYAAFNRSLNLNGFTFSNCYSSAGGGGLNLELTRTIPTIINVLNCVFVQNRAVTSGGGVALNSGGSPSNFDADVLFSNCVFSANSADSGGAGYMRDKNMTMVDCHATGNSADGKEGGGAFRFYGNRVNLDQCTFIDNRSETGAGGGALRFYSAPGTLTDCRFEGNEAIKGVAGGTGNGGAIHSSASLFATNCVFLNNRANSVAAYGGAIYSYPNALGLYNCLVVGNQSNNGADSHAHAIYAANQCTSKYEIVNSTIVSNSGGVGVMASTAAPTVEIRNSIIRYNRTASDMINNYTLSGVGIREIYNTATVPMPSGDFDGGGNITNDPKFVSLADSDFHLQLGSPCIDAGLTQDWMIDTADLDGFPRVDHFSKTVDMGCYEYQKSGTVLIIL